MSFQHFYGLADDRLVPSRLASVDEELYRSPAPADDFRGRPFVGPVKVARHLEETAQWRS
jgi:hypothetical protein